MPANYKRRVAPLVIIGHALWLLWLLAVSLPEQAMTSSGPSPSDALWALGFLLNGIGLAYWAMAKGHSPANFLFGLLPVVGVLMVARLRDKQEDAPPDRTDEAEIGTTCPHCGASYREGDYSPDAKEILCGSCRGVLPRKAS